MARTYIALTLDGRVLDNKGAGYVSRVAARAAADRLGTVAVETRELKAILPSCNDAYGWDSLRMDAGAPSR